MQASVLTLTTLFHSLGGAARGGLVGTARGKVWRSMAKQYKKGTPAYKEKAKRIKEIGRKKLPEVELPRITMRGLTSEAGSEVKERRSEELSSGLSPGIARIVKNEVLREERNRGVEKRSIDNPGQNIVQIRGIPKEWTEGMVLHYFDPKLEKILEYKPILNKMGLNSGTAILKFKDRDLANKFIQRYNNDFIELADNSYSLNVRMYELQTKEKGFSANKMENTIMIYDLPFEATNKEIADLAGQYGTVLNLYMPMRNSTKNKGYAVIEYADYQSTNELKLKCEGMSLFGRELKFKTGDYSFAQVPRKKLSDGKPRSTEIMAKAETEEVKIKGYLSSLLRDVIETHDVREKARKEQEEEEEIEKARLEEVRRRYEEKRASEKGSRVSKEEYVEVQA